MPRLLFTIALVCGLLPSAQAHDPGISRGHIQWQDTDMMVRLTLARSVVEPLLQRGREGGGSFMPVENTAVRAGLHAVIAAGIEVRDATQSLAPASISIEAGPDDSLVVALEYAMIGASAVEIQIPLLAQLPRGHRMHLTVQEAHARKPARYLLDRSFAPIRLQAPPAEASKVVWQYLVEGVWHIWIGLDHIAFLLTLLLPAVLVWGRGGWQPRSEWRPALVDILKIITAFTIAHSLTLALAALGVVSPPARLVETLIAFSVLVVAVNNLRPLFRRSLSNEIPPCLSFCPPSVLRPSLHSALCADDRALKANKNTAQSGISFSGNRLNASRWLLAFAFGLVHGFGFAGVLNELGLPDQALFVSLLGFNLGVEIGQVAIVALAFPLVAGLRRTRVYRIWVFGGGSAIAALVATLWMYERIFDYAWFS